MLLADTTNKSITPTTIEPSIVRSWSQFFIDLFGRVTSQGMFIPEIDGLRFVAIMGVLVYHITDSIRVKTAGMTFAYQEQNLLNWLFVQGSCGVPLFFIISGFILAIPFIKAAAVDGKTVSLRKFYLRRLTRLEPPYLVNLVVLYALLCFIKHLNPIDLFPHLVASMFYVHNIAYSRPSEINVVAWSLEIEAQFYILAPLLFLFLFRMKQTSRLLLVLTIMFATSLFRASGIIGKNPQVELSLLGKYEYFLAGILLADLYLTYIKPEFKKTYSWDLVSISSWCLIPYVWSKPNLSVLLPYVAMLAYWGVFRGVIFNAMLRFLPTVLIGGMCYSIYLYHFLFISLVGSWTIFNLTLDNYYLFLSLQVFIISSCSIIGSSVFFVILEKPFMRWKLS